MTATAAKAKKPARKPPRPSLARLEGVTCAMTVPLVFLLIARRVAAVSLYPHSTRQDVWCFRFGRRALLEMTDDGGVTWVAGSAEHRAEAEALVALARLKHATLQAPIKRRVSAARSSPQPRMTAAS